MLRGALKLTIDSGGPHTDSEDVVLHFTSLGGSFALGRTGSDPVCAGPTSRAARQDRNQTQT